MPIYTLDGYEFDYAIAGDNGANVRFQGNELMGTFTFTARVSHRSKPLLSSAKNWWIGFVQKITEDNMFLSYSDGEIVVVRSFTNNSRDLDASQMRLDRHITLFDTNAHAAYPISLASKSNQYKAGLNADDGVRRAMGVAENTILFNDTPTFTFNRMRQQFDYATFAPTAGQAQIGFRSPVGDGRLERITGRTAFALWLVLMKNPTMVATGDYAMLYDGRAELPMGPTSLQTFHPIYYWCWSINWDSAVIGNMVVPRGRVNVELSGPGQGPDNPTFGVGDVATEKMGYAVIPRAPVPARIPARRASLDSGAKAPPLVRRRSG